MNRSFSLQLGVPCLVLVGMLTCSPSDSRDPAVFSGPGQQTAWGPIWGDPVIGEQKARIYCIGCHLVEGEGHALVEAPAFEVTAGRDDFDAEFFRAWLKNPTAIKPGTRMPLLGLNDTDIEHILAYVYSHRAKTVSN